MGDEDDRDAQAAVQVFEQRQDRLGNVEGAGSLVGEEDRGIVCQRAGNGDALFLAAGKLRRISVRLVAQLHQLQQFQHAAFDSVLFHAAIPERVGHVLENGAAVQ